MGEESLTQMATAALIAKERNAMLPYEEWRAVVAELARRGVAGTNSDAASGPPQTAVPSVCPGCGGELRKLSIVYEEGTSQTTGVTTGGGVGYSAHGGIGVMAGSAQSSSTTSTALAQRAAPPKKRDGDALPAIVSMIVWFAAVVALNFTPLPWWAIWGVASAVAIAAAVKSPRPNARWNKEHYHSEHLEWSRKWICMRCGKIHAPTAS